MSFFAELENTWAKLPAGGFTIIGIEADFGGSFTVAKCPTLEQARHRLLTKVIAQYNECIEPFEMDHIEIDVDDDNGTFTLVGYSDDVSDEVKNAFEAFMAKNTLTAEEFKNTVDVLDIPESFLDEEEEGSFLIR